MGLVLSHFSLDLEVEHIHFIVEGMPFGSSDMSQVGRVKGGDWECHVYQR